MSKISETNHSDLIVAVDGDFENLSKCVDFGVEKSLVYILTQDSLHYIDENPNITCILCTDEISKLVKNKNIGIGISSNPIKVFFDIHNAQKFGEFRADTFISPTVKIGNNVNIDSTGVFIDEGTIIHDNVTIKSGTKVGKNCIIGSNCTIGNNGYEFKRFSDEIMIINHFGSVEISDFVELKENVSIHKALFSWDKTIVSKYSKIDAHTHISHGVKIGKRNLIGSHVVILGNSILGEDVTIGANSTILNRIKLKEKAIVSLGSVVTKDVDYGEHITGNFAIQHEKFIFDLKKKL